MMIRPLKVNQNTNHARQHDGDLGKASMRLAPLHQTDAYGECDQKEGGED